MGGVSIHGLAIFSILIVATTSGAQPASKGTTFAFLVACSGYDQNELKSLPYTIQEMDEFRRALEATGVEPANVKFLHDKQTSRRFLCEKAKILDELRLLLIRLTPEDTLIVALNGHGVHFKGDKAGYFCPIDANLGDKKSMIAMEGADGLFDLLKVAKAKRKLLLVNACRNDPASDLAQAARKIQLDDEDTDQVPEGIAALYSCSPGQRSYYFPPNDAGVPKERSLFFHHLIEAWNGRYSPAKTTLEDVFKQVKSRTSADADAILRRPQVPVVKREYSGEWVIREGQAMASAVKPTTDPKEPKPSGGGSVVVPRADEVHLVEVGNKIRIEMLLIRKGSFHMGSPEDEKDRRDDETQHEVVISRDFFMGKTEVTQEQYLAVMGQNPSHFSKTGPGADEVASTNTGTFPVENVTYLNAVSFCKRLNESRPKPGFTYRLPTEAEWEYACRGGEKGPKTRAYYPSRTGVDMLLATAANFDSEGTRRLQRPTAVGRFEGNALGLFDMHGNVNEWCADWAGRYGPEKETDPSGAETGTMRVIRGGSWFHVAHRCRAAARDGLEPTQKNPYTGFRIVLVPNSK